MAGGPCSHVVAVVGVVWCRWPAWADHENVLVEVAVEHFGRSESVVEHPDCTAELQHWAEQVAGGALLAFREVSVVAPPQAIAVSEAHERGCLQVPKVAFGLIGFAVQEVMLAVALADL